MDKTNMASSGVEFPASKLEREKSDETDGTCTSTKVEESLLSTENIDRSSPELWPERIPGIRKFMQPDMKKHTNVLAQAWNGPLSDQDAALIHHLSTLSKEGLIAEVKKLNEEAYQLSLEEEKELIRGRLLNILEKKEPEC